MKMKYNNILNLISNTALLLGAICVVLWCGALCIAAAIGALVWLWYAITSGLFWLVVVGVVLLLLGIVGIFLNPEELFNNEKFEVYEQV